MSRERNGGVPCALLWHPSLTVRKEWARALAERGFDVAECSSPDELTETLGDGPVSIVVADATALRESRATNGDRLGAAGLDPSTPLLIVYSRTPEQPPDSPLTWVLVAPTPEELAERVDELAAVAPAGSLACDDKSTRVLAIEDSLTYRKELEAALEPEGVELVGVASAEEGMRALDESGPFDCILLDLTLPGLSGAELCRRLRRDRRYHTIPILMLTAAEDPETMLDSLQAGADDFIAKSQSFEVVRARLRVQERRRRVEEEARKAEERALRAEQKRRLDRAVAREAARTRLAVEAARLGLWEWSAGEQEVRLAGRSPELLGLAPTVSAVGLPELLRRVSPEDRPRLREAFAGQGEDVGLELRVGCDDRTRWLQARGQRLASSDAHRYSGVVVDVTEERLREEEARLLAEIQDHVMSIVGHDLRSPLSAIVTAAAVLRSPSLEEGNRLRMLDVLDSSSERALELIELLMDYSRARLGGGLALEVAPSSVHPEIEAVVNEVQTAHPDRVLEHVSSGDGPVLVDGRRLAQAVANLVRNAIEHGAPDEPITVVSDVQERGARLQVINGGEGIPAGALSDLFEPFRRPQGPSRDGLGLGLYIVRSIVEAHGGTIEVSSEPGRTCFDVFLPQAEAAPRG